MKKRLMLKKIRQALTFTQSKDKNVAEFEFTLCIIMPMAIMPKEEYLGHAIMIITRPLWILLSEYRSATMVCASPACMGIMRNNVHSRLINCIIKQCYRLTFY